jgi:hypothetical protein
VTGLEAAETVVCLLEGFLDTAMAGVLAFLLLSIAAADDVADTAEVDDVTGISTTGTFAFAIDGGGEAGRRSGKGVGMGPARGWLLLVRRVLGGIYSFFMSLPVSCRKREEETVIS